MIRNPRQLHLIRLGLPAVLANQSGGNTTSNTVTNPWSGQQPYLSSVMGSAQNTYNQYASNPASSVAGFTPDQQQAMGITQGVANGTNFGNSASLNNSAAGYTNNLMNGSYLNSNTANPYLQSMAGNNAGSNSLTSFANGSMNSNPYETGALDAANDAITRAYQTATAPQTSSAMEASGRYGSGANANAVSQNQQNLATQLGNTDASLTNSMYQQNMGNQLSAAGTLANQQLGATGALGTNYNNAAQQQLQGSYNAPNLVNSINGAASNLYNMGGNQQAYNQSVINAPWNLLGNYNSLIQGNYGGTSSTTQPYYNNTAGQVIGGLGSAGMLAGLLL